MTDTSKDIADEWLESLAFFHPSHLPAGVFELRTCGHELRTWEFEHHTSRQWTLNGLHVHPSPRNRKEVKQLLQRLRT